VSSESNSVFPLRRAFSESTDFPLGEITLFFINNTILLPSEY
jgi:hypothetical protein